MQKLILKITTYFIFMMILATAYFFNRYEKKRSFVKNYERLTNVIAPGNASTAGIQRVMQFSVPVMPSFFQNISYHRQQFLLWYYSNLDTASAIGQDTGTNSDKYLIYRCDTGRMHFCAGWADRVKGMIAGYLIANLTGRRFKIEVLKDCDLSDFLKPNLVNWSLPVTFHESLEEPIPGIFIFDAMVTSNFYSKLQLVNFTKLLGSSRFIYFKANLDHGLGFKESTVYEQELSWMKTMTRGQILGTVYKRLFVLHPRLYSRLQEFLQHILPTSQHKLICAHVRMGKSPTLPDDSDVRFLPQDLNKVWTFISEHSTTDFHKVFLMTDCFETLKEAQLQSFKSRLVTTPGPILHVDLRHNGNTSEMCEAQEKIVFDQHVLMNCDVLLISNSGLSGMAAYVRGDRELYCLQKGGLIIPCSSGDVVNVFQNVG